MFERSSILEVEGLGKAYALFDSPRDRIKTLLTGQAPARTHWALAEVSFFLQPGQCLGVVGDNGAGKSTLLKLITGTLRPSRGQVRKQGRLTAILELGAGFHPEFTGRSNLFFAGALLGIAEEEMRSLVPEIIAFAELEAAIDRPVNTDSSGMVVRLAFSLVTAARPDILIIDEALAVGDQHFQKKCIDRIEAFRERGCTILFCSHSLYQVRRLCDRALWLDAGQVRALGETETVLAAYETHVRKQISGDTLAADAEPATVEVSPPKRREPGQARIERVEVAQLGDGSPPRLLGRDLEITVWAEVPGEERPNIAILIERADGVCITGLGTHGEGGVPPSRDEAGLWRSVLTFPEVPLYSGEYGISVFLFDQGGSLVYEEWRDCRRFSVVRPTLEIGLVRLPHRWS